MPPDEKGRCLIPVSKEEYQRILDAHKNGELTLFIDTATFRRSFVNKINPKKFSTAIGAPAEGGIHLIRTLTNLDGLTPFFSSVLSIAAFHWWAILAIPIIFMVQTGYRTFACRGKQLVLPITLSLIFIVAAALVLPFENWWIRIFLISFGSMLFITRMLYVATAQFVFSLIFTNYQFFNMFYMQPEGAIAPLIWTSECDKEFKDRKDMKIASLKKTNPPSTQDAFDALMAGANQRGHYGKQYETAKTRDELMALLSEAVIYSAADIVQSLHPPRCGLLMLRAMKKVSRKRYDRYLEITHGLFAQTIVHVAHELGECLKSTWKLGNDADHIATKAAMFAAETFGSQTRMSFEEKQMFRETMIKTIEDPLNDSSNAFQRILTARGPVSKKVLLSFTKKTLEWPLSLIELHFFVQRWEALAPSSPLLSKIQQLRSDKFMAHKVGDTSKQEETKNDSFPASANEQKRLEEKARGLFFAARVLIGTLHHKLNMRYPELLTLPQEKDFDYFATVAFVCTACRMLHFDVEQPLRGSPEKIIQDELAQRQSPRNAMDTSEEYSNVHRYISQGISEEPNFRKKRELVSSLAGEWVVLRLTDEEKLNERGAEIARAFSDIFARETTGYWK